MFAIRGHLTDIIYQFHDPDLKPSVSSVGLQLSLSTTTRLRPQPTQAN